MCNICGQPWNYPCTCVNQVLYPCSCTRPTGTTNKWDFSSIIYHKSNNTTSLLTGLSLSNGATLQLFAETVDTKFRSLDTTIAAMGYLGELSADPSAPQNGQYWYNTNTTELKIQLNGSVRVITIT